MFCHRAAVLYEWPEIIIGWLQWSSSLSFWIWTKKTTSYQHIQFKYCVHDCWALIVARFRDRTMFCQMSNVCARKMSGPITFKGRFSNVMFDIVNSCCSKFELLDCDQNNEQKTIRLSTTTDVVDVQLNWPGFFCDVVSLPDIFGLFPMKTATVALIICQFFVLTWTKGPIVINTWPFKSAGEKGTKGPKTLKQCNYSGHWTHIFF